MILVSAILAQNLNQKVKKLLAVIFTYQLEKHYLLPKLLQNIDPFNGQFFLFHQSLKSSLVNFLMTSTISTDIKAESNTTLKKTTVLTSQLNRRNSFRNNTQRNNVRDQASLSYYGMKLDRDCRKQLLSAGERTIQHFTAIL